MRYRPRHAEARLRQLAAHFKAVLVVGARQVGKSTLLRHTFPDLPAVVFDPVQDLYGARRDPDLFLDTFRPPLVLDEVQFAPELLPALKRRLDREEQPGRYLLTGSQNLAVLRGVAESMAGRVAVLPLEGLTLLEQAGRGAETGWLPRYLADPEGFVAAPPGERGDPPPLATILWRGGLPGLLDLPDDLVPDYLRSYVQTYVERDVRTMGDIRDLAAFGRFLALQAALTAQELNDSQAGREVGVAPATARAWRDLLAHTYQWREVFPYSGNAVKRVSGRRKGYLGDVGLAAQLQRLSSPAALAVSPLLGALFETWVANEVQRHASLLAVPPLVWHWRTKGGAEVDLVLERDGRLFPVEVKAKTNPDGHDARGLRAFRDTYGPERVAPALLVHAGRQTFRLDERTLALSWCAG